MLTLLSPSKSQDFDTPAPTTHHSQPALLDHSRLLIDELRTLSEQQLQELMAISPKLAALNHRRYHNFSLPFQPDNSKQALCAFSGDVYGGLAVEAYSDEDFRFAQEHLRILSGLYGCLRPLDLIQPYRLEMKTKLATERGDDLYAFWDHRITEVINAAVANHQEKVVVNLASQEYFKAVQPRGLDAALINVVFKEIKAGKARVIAIYAKRARGLMADFIIRHRLDSRDGLKEFNRGGYVFDAQLSDAGQYVFCRAQPR